ncbi:hypothetical protein [Parabacteroides sp.]
MRKLSLIVMFCHLLSASSCVRRDGTAGGNKGELLKERSTGTAGK